MLNLEGHDTDEGQSPTKASSPNRHSALLLILAFCVLLGLMIAHEMMS